MFLDFESMTKEEHKEIAMSKLAPFDKVEIYESGMARNTQNVFFLVRLLIDQVGKEKAIELITQGKYKQAHKWGKMAAEKLGHPKSIAAFKDAKKLFFKSFNIYPAISSYNVLSEEKKGIRRCVYCPIAEALLKEGAKDPETFEVAKWIDACDMGWGDGFNPDMTTTRTKWLLDGDDYCEFVIEVK